MNRYISKRTVGGSASVVAKKNLLRAQGTRTSRALMRAKGRLGEEEFNRIVDLWERLQTYQFGNEHDEADGIIMNLLSLNFSQIEIRAVLKCGATRIDRVNKARNNPEATRQKIRPPPPHAATEKDLQNIQDCQFDWKLENGFPCPHRRPRQYFSESGVTWDKVWRDYKEKMINLDQRVLSYNRFTEYIHYFFPGLRLSRTVEDACDACIRIETQLQDPDLNSFDQEALQLELKSHLDATKNQRSAMNEFIKMFVNKNSPHQLLPEVILPEYIDDEFECVCDDIMNPKVLIQAEDYGGSLVFPFYGFVRPSADYFNSNLIIHNFVIANISTGNNYVQFYDERGQDKCGDALCSLRLRYHLMQISGHEERPTMSLSIKDNCVGQNKSNITFQFSALKSLIFYECVVSLFLIPGHSHNIADRVVAWNRRKCRGKNVYEPQTMAELCNLTKSVKAEFLDHNDPKRPFFVGWSALLDKYFKKMPPGFTFNYYFEFVNGNCTMKKLTTTPDEEAIVFNMVKGDPGLVRKAILQDLFGSDKLEDMRLDNVQLARHAGNVLKPKKLKSLSQKYFSIPDQYLGYYPNLPEGYIENDDEKEQEEHIEVTLKQRKTKRKVAGAVVTTVSKKPKVGRPKKPVVPVANQTSILEYFLNI